jgi:predicted DNA-binding protein with PD1-like motif
MSNERLNTKLKKSIFFGLKKGKDLLQSITDICIEEDIKCASIECIGSVQNASLAYYDQVELEYVPIDIHRNLEIASLTGNVSIKDNLPFVHAHVVFSDKKSIAYAGHLSLGTKIFSAELLIHVFTPGYFERKIDSSTKLFLWKESHSEG